MNQSQNQQFVKSIDYKDVELLGTFLDAHGRLMNRKRTGLSAKKQRRVSREVKRARFMALLPYLSR